MGQDLVRHMEAQALAEVSQLRADNARLRALVKTAESLSQEGGCVWCFAYHGLGEDHDHELHTTNCPAFAPDGEVK